MQMYTYSLWTHKIPARQEGPWGSAAPERKKTEMRPKYIVRIVDLTSYIAAISHPKVEVPGSHSLGHHQLSGQAGQVLAANSR